MSDALLGIPQIESSKVKSNKNYWLIRTQGGRYYNEYREKGFIGINWEEISIDDIKNLDHTRLKTKIKNKYPEKQGPGRTASQLKTFVNHIKKGDTVIITGPSSSVFSIGNVIEDDAYTEELPPSVFEEGSRACPFSKRKRVQWLKEYHKWEMEMKFFKLLQHAQNTISDANEYGDLIESMIHDFFIRGDYAQFSLKVKKDSDIPFHQFFAMGNELYELAVEFNKFSTDIQIDLDAISTEINVNSPGKIKFKGIMISVTIVGLLCVAIAGGKFKFSEGEVEFETNSVLQTVSDFLDHKQTREHKDMLIHEYMNELEIEVPEELKSLIIEEEKSPQVENGENNEEGSKKPRKLDSKDYN